MSKGIDYSKWDHLDDDSGDSDNDGGDHARRARVTRLEQPSRVTLGPDGVYLEDLPALARASPFAATTTTTTTTHARHDGDKASTARTITTAAAAATTTTRDTSVATTDHDDDGDEDALLYAGLTRNGGREGDSHLWSQTRDTVTVSFIVPPSTRAHDVRHFAVYNCHDAANNNNNNNNNNNDSDGDGDKAASLLSQCAIAFDLVMHTTTTTTTATTAKASSGDNNCTAGQQSSPPSPSCAQTMQMHYVHELRYPVKLDADLLEGCWQLHSLPSRALRLLVVELHKAPIGLGMTLWWDRCFVDDTRSVIDTTQIADRRDSSGSSSDGGSSNSRSAAFARVWQEAHEAFRQRMQQQQQQRRRRHDGTQDGDDVTSAADDEVTTVHDNNDDDDDDVAK